MGLILLILLVVLLLGGLPTCAIAGIGATALAADWG